MKRNFDRVRAGGGGGSGRGRGGGRGNDTRGKSGAKIVFAYDPWTTLVQENGENGMRPNTHRVTHDPHLLVPSAEGVDVKRLNKEGKVFSRVLRHRLVEMNISFDDQGYVNLKQLKEKVPEINDYTVDHVQQIVDNDEKSRFHMKLEDGEYFIRANQGHSKEIGNLLNPERVLRRLTEPIEGVFHGSYVEFRDGIMREGLLSMRRSHVHLAKSIDAKSGKRSSCTMLVYVDMARAMNDGIVFYESLNNVILTEHIPAMYLNCVSID